MGLDNGITIKPKTKKGEEYLERYFHTLKDKYSNKTEYEFGYWRRCRNIRAKFIDDFNYDKEKQKIKFKIEDIPQIIETLKYFLNEDNWEYNGYTSQIFIWIEEVASIANAMHDLYLFYEHIDEGADNEDDVTDEDFEIYFYNSY